MPVPPLALPVVPPLMPLLPLPPEGLEARVSGSLPLPDELELALLLGLEGPLALPVLPGPDGESLPLALLLMLPLAPGRLASLPDAPGDPDALLELLDAPGAPDCARSALATLSLRLLLELLPLSLSGALLNPPGAPRFCPLS